MNISFNTHCKTYIYIATIEKSGKQGSMHNRDYFEILTVVVK